MSAFFGMFRKNNDQQQQDTHENEGDDSNSIDSLLHELCTGLPNAAQLAEQLRLAERTVAVQSLLIERLLRERALSSPAHAAQLAQWTALHRVNVNANNVNVVPPPPPRKFVVVGWSSEQLAPVVRDTLAAVASLVLQQHGIEVVWRTDADASDDAAASATLGIAFFGLKTSRTQPSELAALVRRVRARVPPGGNVLVVTSRTWNKSNATPESVAIEDYVLQNRQTMPSDGGAEVGAVLGGLSVVGMHHKLVGGSEFASVLDSDVNRQAVAALAELVGVAAGDAHANEVPMSESRVVCRIADQAV